MSTGFWSGCDGKKSAPTCSDTVLSCAMAAGRYTSHDTVSTFFFLFSLSHLASLPTVVVLPAPCRPAIRMIAGGWTLRFSSAARPIGRPGAAPATASSPPMMAVSSRCTMPTSAWPGDRLVRTSSPSAFSLTRAMNSRTTGSATSASSSARRTSRSISAVLASVRRASPRMVLTTRASRWVRLSSMTANPGSDRGRKQWNQRGSGNVAKAPYHAARFRNVRPAWPPCRTRSVGRQAACAGQKVRPLR